jgi:hypothetical protein
MVGIGLLLSLKRKLTKAGDDDLDRYQRRKTAAGVTAVHD